MSFPKLSFDITSLTETLSKSNEISISTFIDPYITRQNNMIIEEGNKRTKLKIEELNNSEFNSTDIMYSNNDQKILVSVYGPREQRFREKCDYEKGSVELNIKYSDDIPKESQDFIIKNLKNIVENSIQLTEYPKCQITISLCVFSIHLHNNKLCLLEEICNATSVALCLSGINILFVCLGYWINNLLLLFNVCEQNKIFNIISDDSLNIEELDKAIKEGNEHTQNLFINIKRYLNYKINN